MLDIEIEMTSNKRLLFLRYLDGEVKKRDTDLLYLNPIYLGETYGINLETISAVLTHLRMLGHIVIDQEPNYSLPESVRLKRDDEEDYYIITLTPTFSDYLNAVETAATFFTADKIITPGSGIKAELSFESFTMPVVTVQGIQYRLKTMRTGIAFNIVSYCLAKRPNQPLTVEELRAELKANGYQTAGIINLKENLRNSLFGHKQPLSPFVEVSPSDIQVKSAVLLTELEIETIIKATH